MPMVKVLYFMTDTDAVSLKLALEHKDNEVGVCLLQDAVYFGCKGKTENRTLAEAVKRGLRVFAAGKDIELRGLTKLIYPEIKVLDYDEIVDLVLKYERIVNI
jgi:sulfur relay protein TusB/DsrH